MIILEQAYTYEKLLEEQKLIAGQYPTLCSFRILGESHDQRSISMVRAGFGDEVLFCTGGIHGRESVNPIILLKMLEAYCQAFENRTSFLGTYQVQKLLERYAICFVPLVNPDGYEIARAGFGAIRNPKLRQAIRMRGIKDWEWKANARGVDINRNFPCSSYAPQLPGEVPASEQETKALMELFGSFPSIGCLDFHSRGKIIYYYRQAMPLYYNHRSLRLAKGLQRLSHYQLGKKEEEQQDKMSGGNSVQYYSELTGKPAITVETVEEEAAFPLHSSYQSEAFREVAGIPLEILNLSLENTRGIKT